MSTTVGFAGRGPFKKGALLRRTPCCLPTALRWGWSNLGCTKMSLWHFVHGCWVSKYLWLSLNGYVREIHDSRVPLHFVWYEGPIAILLIRRARFCFVLAFCFALFANPEETTIEQVKKVVGLHLQKWLRFLQMQVLFYCKKLGQIICKYATGPVLQRASRALASSKGRASEFAIPPTAVGAAQRILMQIGWKIKRNGSISSQNYDILAVLGRLFL